jgi:hypothetical protein
MLSVGKSSLNLRHVSAFLILSGTLFFSQRAFSAESRFQSLRMETNGWWRVDGVAPYLSALTLEASPNLNEWTQIAVLHQPTTNFATNWSPFTYLDPGSTNTSQRFYRFSTVQRQPTNDWKNQVYHPYDDFLPGGFLGGPDETLAANERWIKFAIVTNEPTRVFYSSIDYPFHYDFASARLPLFQGVSPIDFNRQTLFATNRRAWLGTVLYSNERRPVSIAEYGIQFVSQDEIPPQTVRDLFELVKSTVVARPGVLAFYIPTFEQFASANANRAWFASNGIPVTTAERWAGGDICYSAGWALGRLVFVAATNVSAAYASGQLRPQDILITDGVPAELPYVAGIISLTPSTANSHVAILARSYGVPFIYLFSETERSRVLQLTNREVVLQAAVFSSDPCRALVVERDSAMTPEVEAEIRALQSPPPLNYTPKEAFGGYWTSTEGLLPADIKYFGGKAANYGLLRRAIPSNAPVAIAISFDLWDEFLDQPLAGGNTLRQEIRNRLAGFTYPHDVAALQIQLAAIRNLIRQSTQFTAGQEQAITNALAIFDSRRNIRFRSSTNVEDAESFSGAGLYDSFSGCLADDQDGDTAGPSICDPTETGERGVFRAIRRVYASFYNDNAFLERLRHGVDENTVGMAMLVHHSTPDDIEMANGVATLTRKNSYPRYTGNLVTQLGAVSVANPDGTALPEEVSVFNEVSVIHGTTNDSIRLNLDQYSSLQPRGAYVMDWPTNYRDLSRLLFAAGDAYAGIVTNKPEIVLDFEYKKVSPGQLEVKQVREVPQAVSTNIPPYLLNQPATFVNFQGVYANVWTAHRLKSRWTLNTRTMQMTVSNMTQGVYTDVSVEYLDGTNVQTLSGPLSSFPNAAHSFTNSYTSYPIDRWQMSTGAGGLAEFELQTINYRTNVSSRQPFITLADISYLILNVRQPWSLPFINHAGQSSEGRSEQTHLLPALVETHNDVFKDFTFQVAGQGTNVVVRTSFWHGSFERFGSTPPLIRFVETRIEGFTSEPIVLRSYWSQTYSAAHAPGLDNFLFEPRLEPGLPAGQLAELNAADIAVVYLHRHASWVEENGVPVIRDRPILRIVGLDGASRTFSDLDFED